MSTPNNVELTERELEVLKMLAHGYSTKDISEHLYLSNYTVEYHRKQLLRKTSSRNVAELVGKAYRWQLLNVGDDSSSAPADCAT